jgi:uncharacterized membrane protein
MILLIPLSVVNCQNYVKYSIQLNADGSALWKIIHFSETNASVDTWAGFQNKALDLVNSASNITHRSMSIDENSMQINTTVSSESKTTEYTFLWQNFSIIQGNQIIFGDVFQVNSFFSQLYGDAAVEVCYPTTFEVKSVNPPPYQQDNPAKTLEWARTQDLLSSKTNIILTNTAVNENSSQNNWQQYIIAGSIVLVGATVFFAGFFMFKRRKNTVETAIFTVTTVETEEEKILKLLKSSGGSLRQSVIVEQCRFSKAKTSQLLAILERKGNITRLKKGRDKIVTLKETAKR